MKIACRLLFIFCTFSVLQLKAGTYNIAPEASVTASSSRSSAFDCRHVTDGIIGVDGKGEWACEGQTTDWGYIRFPWVQLAWKQPQRVDRIVLYDRPSALEHIAGGRLIFSDGTTVWVNQLPNDGTGKAISFESKTITWVKFEVTDGNGSDLGLSEFEVFAARNEQSDYVSWVDPYIETDRGRYFYFITGCRPFGMVGAAPHTRNKNQNGGGYNYNEQHILGFGQIHTWMISGLEIMPTPASVPTTEGEEGWKSFFSHDDEIVQPGYQRVYLQTHHVWTELTATDRVSLYRFTYTKSMDAQVIMNLGGYMGNSTMANADVHKVNDHELEGSFSSVKRYWGGPKDVKVFFVVQFDQPFSGLKTWKGKALDWSASGVQGDSAGIAALYPVKAGQQLQMKIAISYTTIDNARQNLQKECNTWDFNSVRHQTQSVWNDWLGKIEVKGGTTAQHIKLYTDLWHVLMGRQKLDDVSGDYPDRTTGKRKGNFTDAVFKIKRLPMTKDGTPRYHMYNSDAFWLSQWNLNVLWGLAWPSQQDDMTASMLQYADNGYLLPRGPSGGGYSYIMTSCPTTNLVVSTYMKGIMKKSVPKHAYDIVRRNNMPGGMLGSKEDIEFYVQHGWWPDNAGITIEAAFQDWGIAQMAKRLGYSKDVQLFMKRSQGWRYCFDSADKWLFPKDRQGKFLHHDPLSGAGWVEANAWQATWGLSHELPELSRMMGGNEVFCERLNHAFEKADSSDFVYDYTSGFVSYANQPGCSNAHVFSYGGKPWLTQYWVRKVQAQAYGGTTPDLGYGGHDEDQGQMGGVSVLMSIGLFNVLGNESQVPYYEITSPIFDEIIIHLDPDYYSGKTFTIKTYNNSFDNRYIQSAKLNGLNLDRFWFTHESFAKGGLLELWQGSEPNKNWGTSQMPPR